MLRRLLFTLLLLSTAQLWANPQLQPVVLQLKWYHQFQFAGYYAALEKGYYQEAGLDVAIVEGDPKRDPISDVIEGRADFGIGASELLLARAAGKPVVALAAILQHSPLIVLAKQGGTMQSFHDLRGKHIRVVPHEYELNAMFHAMGYTPTDFTLTPRTPQDIDDLINDKIDAISSYSTDEPFFLEQQHIPMLQVTPRSVGIDFYGDTLFTREALVKNSPEIVKSFRQASLRGWHYAMEHPEEIADLILRQYAPDKDREHLLWEARQMQVLMMPEMVDIGYMSVERWRFIRDTYATLKLLPEKMPLSQFIYRPTVEPRDLTWFYLIAAGSLGIALIVGGIGAYIYRLNRQLRVSELSHRQLIDSSPFPIIITRLADNTIAYINTRAEEHFRVKGSDVINRPAPDFWVDRSLRDRMFELLRHDGQVNDFEAELKTDDGGRFWGYLSAMITQYRGAKSVLVAFNDISERKQMEAALRGSEQRYRILAENAFDVIWTLDLATNRFSYVSPSVEHLRGYSVDEVLQQSMAEALTPDSLQQVEEGMAHLLATGEVLKNKWELEQPCKDGSTVWTDVTITLIRNGQGVPIEVMGITRDITEQRRLRESLKTRLVAIEAAAESVMITDPQGVIEYVNPAFTQMTGYGQEEVIGQKPNLVKSGVHPPEFYQELWATINSGNIWRGEITNRNRFGRIYTESTAIAPVMNDRGQIIHYVAIKHDVTARKQMELRLSQLAHYDMLTGLPNRQLFFERLEQSLSLAKRHDERMALLFIDLDGFKEINDTMGHEAGDTVLCSVAQRLHESLREADTVARMGGDEFVVLLNSLASDRDLEAIVHTLLDEITTPILIGGKTQAIGASIGVSIFPDHGKESTALLSHADKAMYMSKRAGKNRWTLYAAN